jgi:hypothetical protein
MIKAASGIAFQAGNGRTIGNVAGTATGQFTPAVTVNVTDVGIDASALVGKDRTEGNKAKEAQVGQAGKDEVRSAVGTAGREVVKGGSAPVTLAELGEQPLQVEVAYTPPYIDCGEMHSIPIRLHYVEGGYTETHMAMVGRYLDSFANALDGTGLALSAQQKEELQIAAGVYDAGKAVVPDAVWNNPGKPSPEDWKQMCRHSNISTEKSRAAGVPVDREVEKAIIGVDPRVANNDRVRSIIRGHHEKLDGTGYPDKASDIHLESQMLGIADMWDSLTNPRSFRPAKDYDAAASILRGDAKAGKLHGVLVDVFLSKVVPDQTALTSRLGERDKLSEKLKDDCYFLKLRQKQDVAIQCGWDAADQWFGDPVRD